MVTQLKYSTFQKMIIFFVNCEQNRQEQTSSFILEHSSSWYFKKVCAGILMDGEFRVHSDLQFQLNWVRLPRQYLLTLVKALADFFRIVSEFPLDGDLQPFTTCLVDGDVIH